MAFWASLQLIPFHFRVIICFGLPDGLGFPLNRSSSLCEGGSVDCRQRRRWFLNCFSSLILIPCLLCAHYCFSPLLQIYFWIVFLYFIMRCLNPICNLFIPLFNASLHLPNNIPPLIIYLPGSQQVLPAKLSKKHLSRALPNTAHPKCAALLKTLGSLSMFCEAAGWTTMIDNCRRPDNDPLWPPPSWSPFQIPPSAAAQNHTSICDL